MREPELAIVFSPREWANRLVRHITDHGGGRVRLRIVDGRIALEEQYDLLIAEDITSFLDARFVQELRRRGRLILGVYDPEEPAGKDGLVKIGVADVIEATASSEEFVRRVAALVADAGVLGDREQSPELPDGLPPPEEPARRAARGSVLAVGGPPGGCGATELAIELARARRGLGETVVVVDADDAAPAVAQRLGLPLIPNVRSAVDAVFHDAGRLSDALSSVPRGGFEALAGLASAADWSHVRPAEVAEVVEELALARDLVVVNVGSHLEDLTAFGGPDRFGLSRAMLAGADAIVAVGAATPMGVTRLVAWVAEVRAAAPGRPVHVVVNAAPGAPFERGEVTEEIRRVFIPRTLTFLPRDERVRRAAWRGELVAPGPYTRAVARAASAIAPAAARRPARTRRWGRR